MAERPETGLMRFGDDWTGVFIRGDSAKFFAVALGEFIARTTRHLDTAPKTITDQIMLSAVQGLRQLLDSSDQNLFEFSDDDVQKLRKFTDCLKEG